MSSLLTLLFLTVMVDAAATGEDCSNWQQRAAELLSVLPQRYAELSGFDPASLARRNGGDLIVFEKDVQRRREHSEKRRLIAQKTIMRGPQSVRLHRMIARIGEIAVPRYSLEGDQVSPYKTMPSPQPGTYVP